jgi:hypothetical protein
LTYFTNKGNIGIHEGRLQRCWKVSRRHLLCGIEADAAYTTVLPAPRKQADGTKANRATPTYEVASPSHAMKTTLEGRRWFASTSYMTHRIIPLKKSNQSSDIFFTIGINENQWERTGTVGTCERSTKEAHKNIACRQM